MELENYNIVENVRVWDLIKNICLCVEKGVVGKIFIKIFCSGFMSWQ
jgi:hypothetical protein